MDTVCVKGSFGRPELVLFCLSKGEGGGLAVGNERLRASGGDRVRECLGQISKRTGKAHPRLGKENL